MKNMDDMSKGGLNKNRKKLKSFETLRIVAAFLVVFAHLPRENIPLVQYFAGSKIFCGSIGVDIFFVLSGFVVYQNSLDFKGGAKDSLRFFARRIVRIVPLYWTLTFIAFGPLEWNRSYFLHSLLLFPDHSHGYNPAVSVAWTLQFEMYFYVLIALSLVAPMKKFTLIFFQIAGLLSCVIFGFYFGAPIILEFTFGIFLQMFFARCGLVEKKLEKKWCYSTIIFSSLILLLASTGTDSTKDVFGGNLIPRMTIQFGTLQLPRAFAWGIPAVLFVMSFALAENHLKWRLASFGKFTYSIYLWQGFPVPLFLGLISTKTLGGLLLFLLQLVIVACLSYSLIERPYLIWAKSLKIFSSGN